MHLANPGDQFRLAQERQYGKKRATHHASILRPTTHFSDHRVERDFKDDPHGWDLDAHLGHLGGEAQERHMAPAHDAYRDLLLTQDKHGVHGVNVHDEHGMPTVEADPLRHEFVHGTNYEIRSPHAMPGIEHNPHAYPTYNKHSQMMS